MDFNVSTDTNHFNPVDLFFLAVPPEVVALNQRVVGSHSESALLSFHIDNAAPPVLISDIRWYYTANTASGTPDFASEDFMDITNSTSRTSKSMLTFSEDLLTLNVSNIVQALLVGDETDAGRYFLRASNPAGRNNSFVDLVVFGKSKY